jgi:hypothetical protein
MDTADDEKVVAEEATEPAAENPYDFSDPYERDIAEHDPGDEDDSAADDDEADAGEGSEAEPEPEAAAPKPAQEARKQETKVDSEPEQEIDPSLDPRAFLDEELATKVFGIISEQQRKIAKLEEMLNGAGIMAPKEAAISKVGEQFPDVFGKGGSASAEQAEARERLAEAADVLRSTYVKRGKAIPGWDDLLRVAMTVEFPDLAQRAVAQQVKAKRRESQRIARPASRETSLSREERAVRAARKMMLENAAFSSEVPELG